MPPLLMLSACGTSTLTNNASERRNLLTATADAKTQDLTPDQKRDLDQHIHQRQIQVLNAKPDIVRHLSAELNGLLSFYHGSLPPARDTHILLATDTYQGQATAGMIQAWLQQHGCQVQIHTIGGLNVKRADSFRSAMSDLIKWAEDTLPGYQDQQYQIVFNLTGGFKSINGFLQTLGMFYADECIYIFQGSTELLRIPRLPIALDPNGVVRNYLTQFRQLVHSQSLPVEQCRGIPETLLFQVEDQVTLSEWGELIWNRCRDSLYSEKIWGPWTDRIRFSERFRKQTLDLAPDRILILNRRLDQLAVKLTKDHNPSSLDFKPLRGNPYPPSTHECDAWSDQDAKRLFGHFETEVFVIDSLDKGLH